MKSINVLALALFGKALAVPTPNANSIDVGSIPDGVQEVVEGAESVLDLSLHEPTSSSNSSGDIAINPTDDSVQVEGNFSGLDGVQSRNARWIMDEVRKTGTGRRGCEAAIATAMTESSLRILANNKVPSSLRYPRDGFGADHDSVGLYQQRAQWYDVGCGMRADCSTRVFIDRMKTIRNWQSMDLTALCQAVQISEKPTAYPNWIHLANQLCHGF
ncbi:MFS maltose permease [Purpureocillium lavendulum]|uniref:MFS maltose permease n=1 Tax=Purpureocillium lavendulum TaxID=1247861 RepID=A0AB34G7B1_9HYPO|nr:MFS maltose permease [Purpureocillium lavendulum]